MSKWDQKETDLFLECLIGGPIYETLIAKLSGRSHAYVQLFLSQRPYMFEATGRTRGAANKEWRIKEGLRIQRI